MCSGWGAAVETSTNSGVYYKNCLYIVCQSFSPCLDLQVNCRCISWTHQILLFFCFAAESYFQPSFIAPVVTCRRCDLTPSKKLIHNSSAVTKIPSLLHCLEKEVISKQWNRLYLQIWCISEKSSPRDTYCSSPCRFNKYTKIS